MNSVNKKYSIRYQAKRISNKKSTCLKNINKILEDTFQPEFSARKFKQELLSSSALSLIINHGYLSKKSLHTISRYEKIRNFCLKDGPRLASSEWDPLKAIFGGDRLFQGHTTDKDLQDADRMERLWKNSVYILEENKCKDLLEFIMNENVNPRGNPSALSTISMENLKTGLKALKKYYDAQY